MIGRRAITRGRRRLKANNARPMADENRRKGKYWKSMEVIQGFFAARAIAIPRSDDRDNDLEFMIDDVYELGM